MPSEIFPDLKRLVILEHGLVKFTIMSPFKNGRLVEVMSLRHHYGRLVEVMSPFKPLLNPKTPLWKIGRGNVSF